MYISQPRTKFLLGDQNTLRKMYYLSDIIANSRIHKVLSHDVTSAILVYQNYMKRRPSWRIPNQSGAIWTFSLCKMFLLFSYLPATGHVSAKALYVADTSEGKGERIFPATHEMRRLALAASTKEGKGSFRSLPLFSFHPETVQHLPPSHFFTHYAGYILFFSPLPRPMYLC